MYVAVEDKMGRTERFFLCVLGNPYRWTRREPFKHTVSAISFRTKRPAPKDQQSLFIDQKPADIVKRQLTQLNKKLDIDLQPVFVSRKLEDVLKFRKPKPSLVSQQLVVYKFQCGSCNASYVGYTARHLYQRIEEHRYSAIGRHRLADHGQTTAPPSLLNS